MGNNGVCVAVTPLAFNHEERKEYFANARLIAAAPDMRRSSQKLYDALQRYLDVSDCELPAELVEGMNELEAA